MPPPNIANITVKLKLPKERKAWNCQNDVSDDINLTNESWKASTKAAVSTNVSATNGRSDFE